MKIEARPGEYALYKEQTEIGLCRLAAQAGQAGEAVYIEQLTVAPEWRRRGYGSYLLKEVLRRYGGYARGQASVFTAPAPTTEAEAAFWGKFGFAPESEVPHARWVRRRKPDLSAVQLAHDYLAAHLHGARFAIDATCGNGGDTVFLCGLARQVLAMDVQPQAIAATRQRLAQAGIEAEVEPSGVGGEEEGARDGEKTPGRSGTHGEGAGAKSEAARGQSVPQGEDEGERTLGLTAPRVRLVCDSHANLLRYAAPGSADAVLFNFGWLPGAEHEIFSTAASSIPALEAALTALRPGGILSATLYSGARIGADEKQAVLAWLRALPLARYTVLVCEFANWADTAPLPCFVIKK
jgi:N-acetylglutamate synthase-like GNAT family acetyltransferase